LTGAISARGQKAADLPVPTLEAQAAENDIEQASKELTTASKDAELEQVGQQLAPLQITRGGPVIMVQVENEYGSFGKDKVYLNAVRQMISNAGFDVTLFTSDGDANQLAAGTLPDVLAVINFGAGDSPEKKFAIFDKFRQHVPRMCGEFWVGWFDAWGEQHHTMSAKKAADGLDWMLSHGISVNLYMFHGGSTFGFMNGANKYLTYQPIIFGPSQVVRTLKTTAPSSVAITTRFIPAPYQLPWTKRIALVIARTRFTLISSVV